MHFVTEFMSQLICTELDFGSLKSILLPVTAVINNPKKNKICSEASL